MGPFEYDRYLVDQLIRPIANLYRVKQQPQQQMRKQQQPQVSKNKSMQQPESVQHSASASKEEMAR